VVADAEGRGELKILGLKDTDDFVAGSIASARPLGSLDSCDSKSGALEKSVAPKARLHFLLPCQSFALVTREIRAASLCSRLESVFRLLNISLGLPGTPFALASICLNAANLRYLFADEWVTCQHGVSGRGV